jgi:hypothetical protein
MDRLILVGLYRLVRNTIKALTIVKPDTVIRWHRTGFRFYWRWKSRHHCGRPAVPLESGRLIREMSIANPLWGAPRIHGELLKLGIEVGQTSVAKYMARRSGPPSQGWKTFLLQPCRWHCRDGPFRRTDNLVPAAPWFADHGPWPAADRTSRRTVRWAFSNLVVQRHTHSPVIEQGRADIARRRKRGTHYLSSDPGRTAPSMWPDVIYGRTACDRRKG